MEVTKVVKLETVQNKQQLVLGSSEYDTIIKSKGKIALQIGRKFTDISKLVDQNPWQPRVFPISSMDFKPGVLDYNYDIDMQNFDCISCNWKLSQLDKDAVGYTLNVRLVSAYPYKLNTIHLNVINDIAEPSLIPIKINFTTIDGEASFGFEEMPITITFAGDQKVRSRFLIFYYDPEIKYWFNPLF